MPKYCGQFTETRTGYIVFEAENSEEAQDIMDTQDFDEDKIKWERIDYEAETAKLVSLT